MMNSCDVLWGGSRISALAPSSKGHKHGHHPSRSLLGVVAACGARYSAVMPGPGTEQVNYSHAVRTKEWLQIPFPLSVTWTWDSFWRAAYLKANTAIERQAALLFERGNLDYDEVKRLVEVERNGLVKEYRRPLTPMGRLYSEILKPSDNLPTLEGLLKKKGTLEAVLRSVSKTRATVNRMTVFVKIAGPVAIGIEITMTAVVIELAPPAEKERVAAKQLGGATGSVVGGIGGGWAGCAMFSMLASPSLMVPIVGEVTTGGACLLGGIIGTVGGGAFGRWLGEKGGEAAHDAVGEWQWQ